MNRRSEIKADPEKTRAWQDRARQKARDKAAAKKPVPGGPRSSLALVSKRKAQVEGDKPARSTLKKGRSFAVAASQREKCKGLVCVVCSADYVQPAHLISKSACPEGMDDPRAVVPLCPPHHRAYDLGELSLLEHLEPMWRDELAFAVYRFGLVSTLNFVTGDRWAPQHSPRAAV